EAGGDLAESVRRSDGHGFVLVGGVPVAELALIVRAPAEGAMRHRDLDRAHVEAPGGERGRERRERDHRGGGVALRVEEAVAELAERPVAPAPRLVRVVDPAREDPAGGNGDESVASGDLRGRIRLISAVRAVADLSGAVRPPAPRVAVRLE